MKTSKIYRACAYLLCALSIQLWGGVVAQQKAQNDNIIEIVIPLVSVPNKTGKYYSVNGVLSELNLKTMARLKLAEKDRLVRYSASTGIALTLLGAQTKWDFRKYGNRIVLTIPFEVIVDNRPMITPVAKGLGYNIRPVEFTTPKTIVDTKQSVVLIHGLESYKAVMKPLGDLLEKQGVQVFFFEYPNDGPIGRSGGELSKKLKALKMKHPKLTLSIVAHSMGGLVARYCVEHMELNPKNITDLVMIGTPHLGSDVSQLQPIAEFAFQRLPILLGNKQKLDVELDGHGEAAIELMPGSSFLKVLNGYTKPKDINYFVVAGTKGVMSQRMFADLQTRTKENSGLLTKLFLGSFPCVLAKCQDEIQEGLGDGAVSIVSATAVNHEGKLEVKRHHTSLLDMKDSDDEIFKYITNVLKIRVNK